MLLPGDKVMVLNQTIGGKEVEEGLATIRKMIKDWPMRMEGQYDVEFDSEPGETYVRIVRYDQKR